MDEYRERVYLEDLRHRVEGLIKLVKAMNLPHQSYGQAYENAIAMSRGHLPLRILHIPPCHLSREPVRLGDVWNCRCLKLTFMLNRLYHDININLDRDQHLLTSYSWWTSLIPDGDSESPMSNIEGANSSASGPANTSASGPAMSFTSRPSASGSAIADRIFVEGGNMKPVIFGNMKDLQDGQLYDMKMVRKLNTKFGDRITIDLEKEHEILRVFAPTQYIDTMFKRVTIAEPVDMSGYRIAVYSTGKTHRLRLFKKSN